MVAGRGTTQYLLRKLSERKVRKVWEKIGAKKINKVIEVSRLTKRFGNISAVNQITFNVIRGEIFGFLGPNGAGKTTTQRILTGIIEASSGSASIMGFDIKTQALYAKEQIGVVPEMTNVYVDLSAWDNLMLIGSLYGVSKRIRTTRATELLNLFNLYERKNEKTRVFSKGMKQKLLLCMALVHDPKILFLDEPTTGLDVQSSRLIREKILEFNRRGVSVFLTTHNIAEADQLCNRIAIIDHGKIAIIDKPESLKRAFQSVQAIEVSFSELIKDENELREIKGVNKAQKAGDKFRIYTDNPGELIAHLINFSRQQGLRILSLNTLGPDLEEVFVKITEEHRGWNHGKEKSNIESI